MRGVYTAGLVATLIESGLDFPHVSGISAGSSHTVNYVSRDAARAHDSFVDVALSPEFGGYKHWLAGRGIFNVDYLYHDIAEADVLALLTPRAARPYGSPKRTCIASLTWAYLRARRPPCRC